MNNPGESSFSFAVLTENQGAYARRYPKFSYMCSCSKILVLYLSCLETASQEAEYAISLAGQEDLNGSLEQSKALK